MANIYTPTGYYHPTITTPSPGDAALASSVNTAGLRFLADNAAYLENLTRPLKDGGTLNPTSRLIVGGYNGLGVASGPLNVGHGISAHFTIQTEQHLLAQQKVYAGGDLEFFTPIGGTAVGGGPGGVARYGFNELDFTTVTVNITNQQVERNRIYLGLSNAIVTPYAWDVASSGERDGSWLIVRLASPAVNTVLVNTSTGTAVTLSPSVIEWALIVRLNGIWRVVMSGV